MRLTIHWGTPMRNRSKPNHSVLLGPCAALSIAIALGAHSAHARDHPGPTDNVLLKNLYANPAGDEFGRGAAAGDFDGDGISDLAISENGGVRLRVELGVAFEVGSDHVFPFVPSTVDTPFHGYTMVAGDFDGDGRDEIAVAYPEASIAGQPQAGKVYVMNRVQDGSWEVQSTIQAGGGYPGTPQAAAFLGNSLAAGDFNDDGYDDMAIGIRGQIVNNKPNAGAVMIVYGAHLGINDAGAQLITRYNDGLTFDAKEDDYYGWALAAGDFDDDDDDDLAIGILNGSCPNGTDRGGAVVVLKGSASGIGTGESHIWRPGTQGIGGDCALADSFGGALAAGEFGTYDLLGSNYADLAIGAGGTDSGQGAVHVIFGSATGLDAAGNQFIPPPPLPGVISGAGKFGHVLAAGALAHACNFDTLTCAGDSLAIAAPFAAVNGVDEAGVVWVIDADNEGLLEAEPRPILPLAPLKIDGPHQNDQFGNAMAIGDFNGDGGADIAIGAYLYDDGTDADAGAVQVLYQSDILLKDGFEG
jgi:hypothetical protein